MTFEEALEAYWNTAYQEGLHDAAHDTISNIHRKVFENVMAAHREDILKERRECAEECARQRSPQSLAEGDFSQEGEAMTIMCENAIKARANS
ncbi:MAG: hypothetical protein PHQ40_15635 [Anaerolineaceae bacterium]|nr:hypothetical protein [Anaerolineaceae bacterium]